MLLVIELLFLGAGLWALLSGKLPAGLLRILFGKGEYDLPASQARWYGLLLASPLPAALSVSFILAVALGERYRGPALAFEYIYLISVVIASLVIARKIRRPSERVPVQTYPEAAQAPRQGRSYGARLLIILGLAILSCIAVGAAGTLVMTLIASLAVGTRVTGDFSQDVLPFLLLVVTIAVALAASLRLLKLLRD